jgi:hypothetical protein
MAKGGLFMTKTKNYALNQWDPGDPIRRADFNRDNAVLDAALGAAGNCRIVGGSYEGGGVYGVQNPNTLTFDFPPKLLIVIAPAQSSSPWLLVAARGTTQVHTSTGSTDNCYDRINLLWDENTVTYYADTQTSGYDGTTVQFNKMGYTYHYIALG